MSPRLAFLRRRSHVVVTALIGGLTGQREVGLVDAFQGMGSWEGMQADGGEGIAGPVVGHASVLDGRARNALGPGFGRGEAEGGETRSNGARGALEEERAHDWEADADCGGY